MFSYTIAQLGALHATIELGTQYYTKLSTTKVRAPQSPRYIEAAYRGLYTPSGSTKRVGYFLG